MKPESKSDATNPNSHVNNGNDDGGSKDVEDYEEESPEQRTRKRRLGVDPSLIISDGRSKRRKTPSPEPEVKNEESGDANDPKDRERAAALGREIYKKIMESVKDGESMAEPFIKLPPKRQFPDYYETIKHPMCLETVRQKLDKQEYETLKEVVADLGQIFNNAKRYNVKDSHLFQWAKKLHKMTRTFYTKITTPDAHDSESEDEPAAAGPSTKRGGSSAVAARGAGAAVPSGSAKMEAAPSASVDPEEEMDQGGPSNASMDGQSVDMSQGIKRRGAYMRDGPTVYKLVKPVLKSIRDARSRDGLNREIAGIFEQLPDRRDLPDYYSAIKNPISLMEIEERMLARKYETHEEFFDQVELMCSNAMQYNEDDSDVFRDALQIKGILDHHKKEITMRLAQPNPMAKFKLIPPPGTGVSTPPRSNPAPASSHSFDGYGAYPSSIPPSTSPYPAYNGTSAYPAQTPSVPPSSATPNAPIRPYLPPLLAGIVTDEIVTRLPRYPPHEQQAWAASLNPQGMTQYRQILANQEARRRIAAGQPAPPLADTVSAVRPSQGVGGANGVGPSGLGSSSNQHFNLSYRQKPPLPMIKHLDFAFSAPRSASDGSGGGGGNERHAIRLHNLRGVVTHALIIGAETAEIEITAVLASPPSTSVSTSTNPTAGTAAEGSSETSVVSENKANVPIPDVSLRINGNPGTLAKFIYTEPEINDNDDVATTQLSAQTQAQAASAGAKPVGMRWTVPVAHSRIETRLELVSSLSGKTEQCAIYINRQF